VQIVEPSQQSLEIADTIAVGVHIAADRQTIEDAILEPEVVDHAEPPSGPQFAIEYQALGPGLVPHDTPRKMRVARLPDDNFEMRRLLR
jgi:hypothetical protein